MNLSTLAFKGNNKQKNINPTKPAALLGVGIGVTRGCYELSCLDPDELSSKAEGLLGKGNNYKKAYYETAKDSDCIRRYFSLNRVYDDNQLRKEIDFCSFVKRNPKVAKTSILAANIFIIGSIFTAVGCTLNYVKNKFSSRD